MMIGLLNIGSIMNSNDTHTLYTLRKKNAKEVFKLVNRYDSFGEQ